MAQNIATKVLYDEKQRIEAEKEAAINRFDEQLREIDTAIERVSGKKVWEIEKELVYDDEHADYIKGSIEN